MRQVAFWGIPLITRLKLSRAVDNGRTKQIPCGDSYPEKHIFCRFPGSD